MAVLKRYSPLLAELGRESCPNAIQAALDELEEVFGHDQIKIVDYNDTYIGFALSLPVDIPTRGPVGGIDIREQEPILLLLNRTLYPYEAPQVRSDRTTFPVESLPHLNISLPGEPAYLCLHRGSVNDWFAEHSVSGFVRRAQAWLRDAASGRLIREQDHFEPTRLNIDQWLGSAIYSPKALENSVLDIWQADRSGYGFLHSYSPTNIDGPALGNLNLVVQVNKLMDASTAGKWPIRAVDMHTGSRSGEEKTHTTLLGLVVWPSKKTICGEYFGKLPNTFDGLCDLADSWDLPLTRAVQHLQDVFPDTQIGIPIILLFQRPQPLIGSESQLEFLNFFYPAASKEGKDGGGRVQVLGNLEPLSTDHSRHVSNISTLDGESELLMLGCGALGSKVALHLARSGVTGLTLVDKATLSPHNLVRHGLLSESVGRNKAEALKIAIEEAYSGDRENVNVKALPLNALELFHGDEQDKIRGVDRILDYSASASVIGALVDPRTRHLPTVIRGEIADDGRLGLVLMEGNGRNPRLDDLQMFLYDRAIENEGLSRWLIREREAQTGNAGSALEEVTVGLGCSSYTMRMSDDVVSYHSAIAARAIRNQLLSSKQQSGILLSYWSDDLISAGPIEFIEVGPVKVITPPRAKGWTVRMPVKLWDDLIYMTQASSPNETGGLLLGFVHKTRKIIYITRVLDPPADSKGSPFAFRLGIQDIPETLNCVHEQSGGLIGYVGEWHSHPQGPSRLSQQDKAAARQIMGYLKAIGLPTHIMIVTPEACYSHLFHYR